MADTLTATTPLGGYDNTWGRTRLHEASDLALVSIAVPLGHDLTEALRGAWGAAAPAPGRSTLSSDGRIRLIAQSPDQYLAVLEGHTADARARVSSALGHAAYTTDQSDAWAALSLAGPLARTALERVCPVDLHPLAFPVDAAARTVMEHLGALVVRTGEDAFLLLSARSSARSFLHAIAHSVEHVA